jgi:hypothetical protein
VEQVHWIGCDPGDYTALQALNQREGGVGIKQNNRRERLVNRFLLIAFVLLASAKVRADGIPWDHAAGCMAEPFIHLTLSEAQMAEYRGLKKITLSAAQLRRLRKRAPGFSSQIKEVLPYDYGDCTCCVGSPYAVMLPGEYEIAIPLSEIASFNQFGARDRPSFSSPAKDARGIGRLRRSF